jgi:hypothetical protein
MKDDFEHLHKFQKKLKLGYILTSWPTANFDKGNISCLKNHENERLDNSSLILS